MIPLHPLLIIALPVLLFAAAWLALGRRHSVGPYMLFLDDERSPADVTWIALPPGSWVIVRTYGEFVSTVSSRGIPSFVSFDHDLADFSNGVERTGSSCARWLAERCVDTSCEVPSFSVHSKNSVGAENIESIMTSAARVISQKA